MAQVLTLVYGFVAYLVFLGAFLYALGLSSTESVILGAALSLSSTAIVIPILSEDKRLNSPTGRRSFAILLFQDLAVIPLLIFLFMAMVYWRRRKLAPVRVVLHCKQLCRYREFIAYTGLYRCISHAKYWCVWCRNKRCVL